MSPNDVSMVASVLSSSVLPCSTCGDVAPPVMACRAASASL
ncbi:MAG: hypothetical protein ACYSUA_06775 [Planctomycetota bacterium]